MIRSVRILLGWALLALLAVSPAAMAQSAAGKPEILVIDAAAPARPFPHFWEHMFGSGRASLSMRESYRNDLRRVKQITEVGYIRFHAIFLDEMGVYDEDARAGRCTTSPMSTRSTTVSCRAACGLCRAEFHAEETGGARMPPRLLVQAKCLPAERLEQVGRPD